MDNIPTIENLVNDNNTTSNNKDSELLEKEYIRSQLKSLTTNKRPTSDKQYNHLEKAREMKRIKREIKEQTNETYFKNLEAVHNVLKGLDTRMSTFEKLISHTTHEHNHTTPTSTPTTTTTTTTIPKELGFAYNKYII